MADEIETLYARLTAGREKAVRDRPIEDRRAYGAARVREHRQRQKQAVAKGSPEPTVPMIREALADAALALLAVDGPGSDQIRHFLGEVFVGRSGVPGTVTARAKAGALKPKLLKSR